jgi:hypothetical protein
MVFKLVPEESMSDPELLQQFAGSYAMGEAFVTV